MSQSKPTNGDSTAALDHLLKLVARDLVRHYTPEDLQNPRLWLTVATSALQWLISISEADTKGWVLSLSHPDKGEGLAVALEGYESPEDAPYPPTNKLVH